MLAEVWPTGIPLYGRDHRVKAYALVDTDDWESLTQFPWHLTCGYASRSQWVDGRMQTTTMSRQVVELDRADRRQVDHKNGDKLDNRRCNLRVCTRAENGHNRRATGKTSSYRGVCWRKRERKWQARVRSRGITRYGLFETEEEAARAAHDWRCELLSHTVETREGHCP